MNKSNGPFMTGFKGTFGVLAAVAVASIATGAVQALASVVLDKMKSKEKKGEASGS